ALRPRHPRIARYYMYKSRGLCVLDVLQWRYVPVVLEIIVGRPIEVIFAVALDVALGVHRNPIDSACAGGYGLESIGMGKDPVGPVPPGTPSHHTHLVLIDHSRLDQVIDAGHYVIVTQGEVFTGYFHLELLAVVRRSPVVGQQ